MVVGELIIEKIDKCVQNAIKFAEKNDWSMVTFWKNASIGLKKKMERNSNSGNSNSGNCKGEIK